MENATKALIIAATVLISIIIISIAVVIWKQYSSYVINDTEKRAAQQINEFNIKFEKYQFNNDLNNPNYITAQEARTIINMAKEYNDKYEEEIIKVEVKNLYVSGVPVSSPMNWSDAHWVKVLTECINGNIKFKCKVSKETNSDIIGKIEIIKI